MATESFQPVQVCEVKHGSLESDIREIKAASIISDKNRKDDLKNIYGKIDKWGDRLPTWGVFLMTAGSGLIGILVTVIGFMVKAN